MEFLGGGLVRVLDGGWCFGFEIWVGLGAVVGGGAVGMVGFLGLPGFWLWV